MHRKHSWKSTRNQSKIDRKSSLLRAPNLLAFRNQFRLHFGSMFASFCLHFSSILLRQTSGSPPILLRFCSDPAPADLCFWTIVGAWNSCSFRHWFLIDCRSILEHFWTQFWMFLDHFWRAFLYPVSASILDRFWHAFGIRSSDLSWCPNYANVVFASVFTVFREGRTFQNVDRNHK